MDDRELVRGLTGVVLGVDGVVEIFPAAPALVDAAVQAAQVVTGRGEEPRERIVVTGDAEHREVRIRIGVDAAASTVAVVREVSDAVEAALTRAGEGAAVVHVEVGSIT